MLEVVEAHLHPWLESYNYWHHRLTAVAGIRKVVLIQILLIWHVYYSRSFHRILPWSTGILNIRDRGGAVVGLRENSFLKFFVSYCFLAKIGEISGSHWYCGHESWQVFTFYITPPWLYAFLDQNKPTSICTTTTTMLRMVIMTGLKYPTLTDFPIGSSVSYRARILLLLSSESSSRSQTTRTHSEPPIKCSNVQRSTI